MIILSTIYIAIIIISLFTISFGMIIIFTSFYFKIKTDPMIEQINLILPQYQCGQCDYPSCLLYAESIINNNEKINKCIPGGEKIIFDLSKILNKKNHYKKKYKDSLYYELAFIDEKNCIGCTKCAQICPIDAIIGAKNTIHTVLKSTCTGCKLCISPCPTDCIKIVNVSIDKLKVI